MNVAGPTTNLVNGQNMVWPGRSVVVEVHAGGQCDVSALLLDADHRVRDSDDFVFYNQPSAPGVSWSAGPPQRIVIDLAAVPTERVSCVLSVDPDQPPLGAGTVPLLRLLDGPDQVRAEFRPTALNQERALIGVEVYRRAGQWKIRAVGQGYAGGLGDLIRAHGVEVDDEPAAPAQPSPPPPSTPQPSAAHASVAHSPGASTPAKSNSNSNSVQQNGLPLNLPRTAAPAAPSWDADAREQEELLRLCRAIMEDASRSTAGLLSTRRHAESVLHQALEQLVDDPRMRHGAAADQARREAQNAHDRLVDQASANHRRDVAQLVGELADWERRATAGLARWDSPAWARWQPLEVVAGIRVGHLTLPDAPQIEVPFLLGTPLHRPVWIDPEIGGPQAAAQLLRIVLARLLSGYGERAGVDIIDPAGGPTPLTPLGTAGCRIQASPAAVDLDTAKQTLRELLAYEDRVTMAAQAGLLDELDLKVRFLVLTDFPTGLDDEALVMLHQLVDEARLVQILFVGTDSESVPAPPLARAVFRSASRVPAGVGGALTDGFGGVEWHFVPDAGPADPRVLDQVLERVSRGE